MTPQQITTAKRLAALGIVFVVCIAYAFVIESQALIQGGQSSISEMVWLVWANQPWVIWIVSVLVTAGLFFLAGHWLAQSSDKYRQMRDGKGGRDG